MPLLSVVTDAPWQIIDKKTKKEVKIETTSIQSGFVAAKGSVPVKSGKKRKLEEPGNLSAGAKKTKATQMLVIPPHLLDSYGMVVIIAVHMIHPLQSYMKSGPLTQRLGQENSRKSTSAISSQCLPVSRNI
jgi:hypothetical protein